MPSLDSLPGDQRAVLQLVLGRGRSYEEIARLLSINLSAVRERAHAAVRALGPQTTVPADRQAQIADYLLGQLSDDEAGQVRDLLADSPSERAWARVLSSELAPMASGPLPEIPVEGSSARRESEPAPEPEAPALAGSAPAPGPRQVSEPVAETEAEPTDKRRGRKRRKGGDAEPPGDGGRRSSLIGGAVLIAVAVVAVAAVAFVLLRGGGGNKHPAAATPTTTTSSTPAASAASSNSATTGTSTTGSSTSAKVVAQINLSPPSGSHASKAAGIAEILNEGSADGVAIVAQNVPPNANHPPNAYAVWLYNSPTDAQILGFVNPGVGKTGRLSTAGGLPPNAKHYKNLILTLETTAKPKAPGTIVLEGTLTGL